jgi:hypothetical protein
MQEGRTSLKWRWISLPWLESLLKDRALEFWPWLEDFFAGIDRVHDQASYDRLHEDFCIWFTQNIQIAEREVGKKVKRIIPAHNSSFGHAAKVLDIAAKVYVYYCVPPSPELAKALVPMLHGGLDNQIIGHLIERFPESGIKSENLEDVDRVKYKQLQALVRKEILEDFHSEIYPVQYDDILFRKLNRPVATPA